MQTDTMTNWYAIYTKSGCEGRIAARLGGSGFKVLSPMFRTRRLYRRKLQDVVSPLFPCYIFAELEMPSHYRLIKYTRGVRQIVGTEHAPTAVPDTIIDSIMSRMDNGIITLNEQAFSPGESVIIKGGPFEGFEAIFERDLSGSERVGILLKALNARIILDRAFLAKS